MRGIARMHDPILDAFRGDDNIALDRAVADHVENAFAHVLEKLRGHGLDTARNLKIMELRDDAAR